MILSGWDRFAYMDNEYKAIFSFNISAIGSQSISTKDDIPIKDHKNFYETRQKKLFEILENMTKFKK